MHLGSRGARILTEGSLEARSHSQSHPGSGRGHLELESRLEGGGRWTKQVAMVQSLTVGVPILSPFGGRNMFQSTSLLWWIIIEAASSLLLKLVL